MQYKIKLTDEQYDNITFMHYQYQGLMGLTHLKFSKKLILKANAIKKHQTNYIYNIVKREFLNWQLTSEKALVIDIKE